MNAGSFSDRPIDFGGDTWIAVRKSDLPKYQEHSYGKAVSFEPGYETGLDAEGFPILESIPTDKIYIADKSGRLTGRLNPETTPKAVGGIVNFPNPSRPPEEGGRVQYSIQRGGRLPPAGRSDH